jgi:hypothetical protein
MLVKQMEFFAWLEADCLAGGNCNFGAGSGIAADAGLAWLNGKDTKATEFNAVPRNKGLFHALEDGINCRFRFRPREAGAFDHSLYKILLDHLGRRPWAVILKNWCRPGLVLVMVETQTEIVNERTLP